MTARELQNVSKHLSKTHRERGAAFVWPAFVQQAERIGRLIVTGNHHHRAKRDHHATS